MKQAERAHFLFALFVRPSFLRGAQGNAAIARYRSPSTTPTTPVDINA
jgi:hypothetical protein